MRIRYFLLSLLLLLCVGFASAAVPAHKHVYVVVLENHSYEDVVGSPSMPYFNSLISQGALTNNMFGDVHPSIGNYFMLTTGEQITQDSAFSATVSVDNLVRRLRAAGKDWVVYAQSLPSVGYTGTDRGPYVLRHNPFAYFSDVRSNTVEAGKLRPLTDWSATATQPEFVYLLPDNNNNGHDCPAGRTTCTDADKLKAADQWLSTYVKPLVDSGALNDDGVLVITWDEGRHSDPRNSGGRIATAFVGPEVKAGYRSTSFYQHEHLLNTVAAALGLNIAMGVTKYEKRAMDDMFGASDPNPPPCTAPTTNGVVICSPVNNSTSASPVRVQSAAFSSAGIRFMQIYLDGVKYKDYPGVSTLDVQVPMSTGLRRVVVQAGDRNNVVYKSTAFVTVK